MTPKRLSSIHSAPGRHWVGNGFPVRTLLSPALGQPISPFLLLDHAGPMVFPPGAEPRGVEAHPHKGFETVTLVYHGGLVHRDSAGNSGTLGPGDVQWMTAGSGVVHEEMHSPEFARRGGTFEVVQIWVNLPAQHKDAPPGYQSIPDAMIPKVALAEGAGAARIIAGTLNGLSGPARTFTPLGLLDVRLMSSEVMLPLPDGHTAVVVVLEGRIGFGNGRTATESEAAVFERAGDQVVLEAAEPSRLVLLHGQPIEEPVAARGPFVMNTAEEVRQAIEDYRAGRLGVLA
ncbi:MAG: pirin family protein [Gemmatimonadales bacterium]